MPGHAIRPGSQRKMLRSFNLPPQAKLPPPPPSAWFTRQIIPRCQQRLTGLAADASSMGQSGQLAPS